jgi:tRNA dimethylallyltransferase
VNPIREIVILGPTASGKTALAVALARELQGEVISVDSRQVYRGLDIGSGKDKALYGEVPCHLIDIADPGSEFSLFDFVEAALGALEVIAGHGRTAIFAGGTGLYLDALLKGYELVRVPRNDCLRTRLASLGDTELVTLLASLKTLHNTTDTVDRARTVRAIEIALAEKDRLTAGNQPDSAICISIRPLVFGLTVSGESLRLRIRQRLQARLHEGLPEEVGRLLASGVNERWLEAIGLEYRYLVRYLRGDLTFNDMQQKLASEIIRFARQQMKWFRRLERQGVQIHWLEADDNPLEKIMTDPRHA